MLTLYFIIEGQTEEIFITSALVPYLKQKCINDFEYQYLNLNGGIHLKKLIRYIKGGLDSYDYVTTFIDLARLHNAKFVDYSSIMKQKIPSNQKAELLEQQLKENFDFQQKQRLIPHIQPYEFEALCFADVNSLAQTDPKIKRYIQLIKREAQDFINSESINHNLLPAARLRKYGYIKESSTFAMCCDIGVIRNGCPHFNQWLVKLERAIA